MASTSLNESLACVALGYVTYKKDHSLEDFHRMITQTSGNLWNQVISRCELSDRAINTYRSAFSDKNGSMDPWISTSYRTADQIVKSLKLQNLRDYKFAKVEKDRSNRAYLLKQRATSAIKAYSKEVMKAPGILATLNADKVNIGDIMIIKNNSQIFNTIEELVENTDVTASKLKRSILENEKEFLTMERYRNLMVEAWKDNEIYSVSLKQLDEKSDTIPVKISNLPSSLSRTVKEKEQDEFAAYVSYLIRIAKKGSTYKQFEDAVNEFVDIKPVTFTAQDRLLVYFDLVYKKEERKKYHIFTNFGTGNAIHFVPKGSKSASGEGGITVNYFYTLVKNFPKLKVFFNELADARLYHFEQACKKNNLNSKDINKDLGSNSMYSGKYNSSLYLAKNYEDLAKKMFSGKNAYGYLSKNDAELTSNAQAFSDFFDSYTAYLSKTPGSMGKFLGIAKKSKVAMQGKISKIKKDIDKETKKKGFLTKEDKIKILDKYKTPFITEYKKSYALLCNAEFGFFFAEHQADVEEILKKQVLLSFYAAASGRGYIIFDGKRFSEDDIYEKSVAPPPFLKVGM
jgi:hypothetical protein|tara:strand:- start:3 stop:1715 length:1713 start_codon:yes stop_codon:yes gene_type:complete